MKSSNSNNCKSICYSLVSNHLFPSLFLSDAICLAFTIYDVDDIGNFFSFFTKFLIKQTHELATRNVTERKKLYNFIAERFDGWKEIKLLRTQKLKTTSFSLYVMISFIPALRWQSALANRNYFCPSNSRSPLCLHLFHGQNFRRATHNPHSNWAIFIRLVPIAQSYQASFAQLARYMPSLKKLEEILQQTQNNRELTKGGSSQKVLTKKLDLRT